MYSDDGLSSGGEFYDDNVEFRRPARDIVIKSVPIVPSQQASVCYHLSTLTNLLLLLFMLSVWLHCVLRVLTFLSTVLMHFQLLCLH